VTSVEGKSKESHEEKNHSPYSLRHALCALLSRSGAAAEKSSPDRISSWPLPFFISDRYDAFLHGLRELGYMEGKNIAIERRLARES